MTKHLLPLAQRALTLLLSLCLACGAGFALSGCTSEDNGAQASAPAAATQQQAPDGLSAEAVAQAEAQLQEAPAGEAAVKLEELPAYEGTLCLEVNGDEPGFSDEEIAAAEAVRADGQEFEKYSPLDELGRCGTACAVIDRQTMPQGKRGDISSVHPSGWNQKSYDFVDQEMLYNRSHLIGWQLAGEDANERNLITGTREMNAKGMLPYENLVADYVDETNGSVLYRVTPWFEGDELVARGVQMEARSLEDDGAAVSFNVFVYNIEPGVAIDYADGSSEASSAVPQMERFVGKVEADGSIADAPEADPRYDYDAWGASNGEDASSANDVKGSYVLNTKTGKFHYPTCSSVEDIKPGNRKDYEGSRQALLNQGYEPCGKCNP